MKKLMILMLLIGYYLIGPQGNATYAESHTPETTSINTACESIAQSAKPGALILHKGDCLAVKVFTASPYTHVGVMMPAEDGSWQVYDSANGEGVRTSNLDDYLTECAPNGVTLLNPCQEFNEEQLAKLQLALHEQIGRPYGIKHHLSGEPAKGIHCSEYATTALMAAGCLNAEKPCRVSPASLRKGVLDGQLYSEVSQYEVTIPVVAEARPEGWCSRLWYDTKTCCSNCGHKLGRMFLCRD